MLELLDIGKTYTWTDHYLAQILYSLAPDQRTVTAVKPYTLQSAISRFRQGRSKLRKGSTKYNCLLQKQFHLCLGLISRSVDDIHTPEPSLPTAIRSSDIPCIVAPATPATSTVPCINDLQKERNILQIQIIKRSKTLQRIDKQVDTKKSQIDICSRYNVKNVKSREVKAKKSIQLLKCDQQSKEDNFDRANKHVLSLKRKVTRIGHSLSRERLKKRQAQRGKNK